MFLKINTAETRTMLGYGAHAISGAATMLGGIASVTIRRSSQTERQLRRLQAMIGRLTRYSSVDDRVEMFTYGEAQFWGKPAYVHLDPGVARIIDGYVARVKAA